MVADVDPVHVIGGAERMLNEHCTRLAERGHRVVVLTRREDGKLPAEEEHRGVRVVRHAVSGGGALGFMRSVFREGGRAFARLVAEERFDLVNIHQPLAGAAVLRRSGSAGVPVLYTYLSPWADEYRVRASRRNAGRRGVAGAVSAASIEVNTRIRERIERGVVDRADGLLVLSEFTRAQLRDIHALEAGKSVVVPGGVDTSRFRPVEDRAALRRELSLPDGPLLLTVRNLVPRMGLDELISAMHEVAARHPDVTLVIGGSGPLRATLETQAAALGLAGRVCFAGFISEERLPDYYAAADLFVLPTRCLEGFGLVTIEALACGTPVLGTPIGGTREILSAFDPAFLFTSPEAEAMAAQITDTLPRLGAELRERCREFVLQRYDWEVLIPRVEELMASVVQEKIGRG